MVVTPALWAVTLAGLAALFLLDFFITRKPHEVSLKEAAGWSVFYVALPVAFGVGLWFWQGGETGLQFFSGYVVEKSLSVDNLFVFMLVLSAFAVPKELMQRVLLIGVAGALVLRGIFIAAGAVLLQHFTITFLFFGLILLASAWKVWKDANGGHESSVDVDNITVVRWARKLYPVTDGYRGTRWFSREGGRRAITPFALATLAILGVDILFAVDSVPAIFGITDNAYLVFVTNAFALLGLRALYFLLTDILSKLVHLGHGLALILVFIGVKLVLHWAHTVWPAVPTVPTMTSLVVILGILATVTVTSLVAGRREAASAEGDAAVVNPAEQVADVEADAYAELTGHRAEARGR